MNYTKTTVNEFLRGYGMMLDSLDKKAIWRKKYQVVYITTRKIYCEADTLKELIVEFNERRYHEQLHGSSL